MPQKTWMLDRRDFLKAGAAAVAGVALGCRHRLPHFGKPVEPLVRFGFLSDSHYADAPASGTRIFRESLGKMRDAVAELRRHDLAFVLENGDFKDCVKGEPAEMTLGYLTAIEREFRQCGGRTYHTLGNHDVDNITKAQFQAAVTNSGIDPAKTYYGFEADGVTFVVLDACFRLDGAPYDRGNFKSSESLVPDDELAWLKTTLKGARGPVIVFAHQRLDEGGGGLFVSNAEEVRKVLEGAGNVLAVFQGHDHKGAAQQIAGIHYYTVKAMVEGSGAESNSYAVVEVARNGDISVSGYKNCVSLEMKNEALPQGV